jgi:hypothetical protein
MARRLAAPCLLVLGACVAVPPPGDLVGTYAVTGTLLENSCGEQALPAVDPMTFRVELREDPELGRGYWLVAPPARAGTINDSGAFSFEIERSYVLSETRPPEIEITADPELAIDPEQIDRQRQLPGDCVLFVNEAVAGNVARDSGASPTPEESELSGTTDVEVRTDRAPACDGLLVAGGGPWESLPCRVRYSLSGEQTAER